MARVGPAPHSRWNGPEMSGPDGLNDCFAGVMVAVALYSLGRLVAARAWSKSTHVDVDVAHVLMGSAMAGMLVSAISFIPSGVWEVVFTALTGWFVWRSYQFVSDHGVEGRDVDHVHHLSHWVTHVVMALAMLYMYLAVGTPTTGFGGGMAMAGPNGTTTDFVGIPLLFLLVLFASGIWELDGIGRFSPSRYDRAEAELAMVAVGRAQLVIGADDSNRATSVAQESLVVGAVRVSPWLAPRLEAACHIAMCITMGFMLVLLL